MTLDELLENWETDSVISTDSQKLSEESTKTGKLQSKYVKIRAESNMRARKYQAAFNERRAWKQQYFRGEFNNPDDLKKYNVPAYRGPSTSIEINNLLEQDRELNDILLKKAVYDEMVGACDLILKELHNRTFAIGSAIKWNIFISGG